MWDHSRQEMISKSAILPLLLLAAFLLLVISVLNSKRLNSRLLSELEAGQLEMRAAVDTGDKCSRNLARPAVTSLMLNVREFLVSQLGLGITIMNLLCCIFLQCMSKRS